MELRIYRDVDLLVPERMTGACRDFDPSKQASELVPLLSCSHPQPHKVADNCFG